MSFSKLWSYISEPIVLRGIKPTPNQPPTQPRDLKINHFFNISNFKIIYSLKFKRGGDRLLESQKECDETHLKGYLVKLKH